MKTLVLILTMNLSLALGQTTLEWIKKSEFDSIHLPGQKLVFKQLYATETDSIFGWLRYFSPGRYNQFGNLFLHPVFQKHRD